MAPFHLHNCVAGVDINKPWRNPTSFLLRDLMIAEDDYYIALKREPGCRSVDTDLALLTFDRVRSKAGTVVHVYHVDLLVRQDVCSLHQLPVNCDATLVVDV